MARKRYALGLDFGTNSVRALVANTGNGAEIGTCVVPYSHGKEGVVLDRRNPDLARQHPRDYLDGAEEAVSAALKMARRKDRAFRPDGIVGIGVDTTGSTPMPVDREGCSLTDQKRFSRNPAAMAWLWKDHTAYAEAARITAAAAKERPRYLKKCGGTYSSEWFWSKILHCKKEAPEVFRAAHTWVEIADWIPAVLCGTQHPDRIRRGICAAGHKGLFHRSWGGYPEADFLAAVDRGLVRIRKTLPSTAFTIDQPAGSLCAEWARRLGLPEGVPVAVGALDAHLGAVGSGIGAGTLVKIIGTSTCDMIVAPKSQRLPYVPGICGIVPGSILPGFHGLEAGQSAVGDIFNWFVSVVNPEGHGEMGHAVFSRRAARLKAGESGLLALDWNNGNRTVLVDQRLTGQIVGQSLSTTPAEIYRALVEATGFGALAIIDRFEEYGVKVRRVIGCGGIAEKNPFLMQTYADITGRPIMVSRSTQTCALGAAMAGAVCGGAHPSFAAAARAMTGVKRKVFTPDAMNRKTYKKLFSLYMDLHDAFGKSRWRGELHHVMKELLDLRDKVRSAYGLPAHSGKRKSTNKSF